MEYCTLCVMPLNRPGLKVNPAGECGACQWHAEKKSIDWNERLHDLKSIARWAREEKMNGPWDCVVGVSGGKDSFWQAHFIRDELRLNPLLVQFAASDGTELGRRNLEMLVNNGFTLISVQPNPQVARKLARKSFLTYGNTQKYSEFALFSAPFKTAISYNIPVVFFGENPALEAGDKTATFDGWDARGIRHNNTLDGGQQEIWLGDGVTEKDLLPYTFPSEKELERWGGKAIYMGYYLNWSGYNNAKFSLLKGFKPIEMRPEDIGCHIFHNSLDSNNGGILNPVLKHIKLGFGNATEFSCYDIREGRLTRMEAINLVRHLDGKCHPKYVRDFCTWVGLEKEEFWGIANSFRGPMWRQKNNDWCLIDPIWEIESVDDIDVRSIILSLNNDLMPGLVPNSANS